MQTDGNIDHDGQSRRFFQAGMARPAALPISKQTGIGLILIVALIAFELFNFDTTQFALQSLLGDVSFIRLRWASILAIAFCAIDFAGLAHLFTPEKGLAEPKEIWYLTGAWLLGATMNAIMTWWAVSLVLLSHNFGNEVLGRDQLLRVVPIFVALLVWLTRILFIGAISVAGEHLFRSTGDAVPIGQQQLAPVRSPAAVQSRATHPAPSTNRRQPVRYPRRAPVPQPMQAAPDTITDAPPVSSRHSSQPVGHRPVRPAPLQMRSRPRR